MTIPFSKPPHCRDRSVSQETRKAISATIKANPLWAMQHARQTGEILYVWNCVGCGDECSSHSRPQVGYCSSNCSARTNSNAGGRGKNGGKISPAWERADEIVALYRAKDGHKTIAKRLGISPRIAREILMERGEWKPGSLKSLSGGPCSQAAADEAKMRTAIKRMRFRVKKCLNKKPPKPPCQTAGMSEAERFRWMYKNDPNFKILQIYRSRMKKIMGNEYASKRQLELLGCSVAEFRAHIERQFVKGMGWHNNGIGRGKWNADHITPCHAFDQANKAQARICWHWTNFQPLWSITNIKKGKRINHTNAQLGLAI